jgi:serine/threonine-protein kinase RsbW
VKEHRRFPALRSELDHARQFIAHMGSVAGLDSNAIQHCELVIDEAIANIIEHGYRTQSSSHYIDVLCLAAERKLTIIITDDAPAFNPVDYPIPDPNTPLELRRGGGWGVHLIRTLMDAAAYSRTDERNQLTLTKYAAH